MVLMKEPTYQLEYWDEFHNKWTNLHFSDLTYTDITYTDITSLCKRANDCKVYEYRVMQIIPNYVEVYPEDHRPKDNDEQVEADGSVMSL
jgi:hypothetical protein